MLSRSSEVSGSVPSRDANAGRPVRIAKPSPIFTAAIRTWSPWSTADATTVFSPTSSSGQPTG
ncbi:MAG: hypothetical protein F2817_04970 [Actinobacteria bacterium]|nr:hypothetical protein [Actinomycetota bacterium]